MHSNDKKSLIERLSNWKVMSLFIVCITVAGFFVANFLLHFLQQVLHLVEGFAINPEKVNFQKFSVDWHYFFIFQHEWNKLYVGFYIIVVINVMKLINNVKIKLKNINKEQHGKNEFEKMKNMKKQYVSIPSKTKEYEGRGSTIIAGMQEGNNYQLLIDDAPVHTMVIGITRSGKGETFVVPMI